MFKRALSVLFVLAILVSLVAGCASSATTAAPASTTAAAAAAQPAASETQAAKKLVVGFSQMENNMPWRIAETNSIREEAAKRGIELVYTDAQSQTAKQVSDVEDMIAQGVDYILLAPREEEGLAPALAAAKAAGIPVILIDRAAKGEAGVDYVTLIASDFIEEGKRTAQWIIDNHGTKGNIVVLEGTQGASAATERQIGFEEVMKNYPDMKIIAQQTADFTRADGQKVMENFIQAHGKNINFVYAHNDEMAIGAIQAIKAAGMVPGKDIILTSIDGEKDALQAIIAGELGVSVECSPFFGPIAFDTIAKLEAGEKVPTFIKNEDRLFDATNAEEFVNSAF
jgi:ribose transport system substrate-binding protein